MLESSQTPLVLMLQLHSFLKPDIGRKQNWIKIASVQKLNWKGHLFPASQLCCLMLVWRNEGRIELHPSPPCPRWYLPLHCICWGGGGCFSSFLGESLSKRINIADMAQWHTDPQPPEENACVTARGKKIN